MTAPSRTERQLEREAAIAERDPRRPGRPADELVHHLERDQLVANTSLPVPPAVLSARVRGWLWALRVFVVLVSLMVIYSFAHQLY
jgi:hypothetical protein